MRKTDMTSEVKPKGKKDILNFGKYKGKTVEWVLELYPSYLVWAHDTISWFKIKPKIYEEAVDGAYREKMHYYVETLDWGVDPYDFMD